MRLFDKNAFVTTAVFSSLPSFVDTVWLTVFATVTNHFLWCHCRVTESVSGLDRHLEGRVRRYAGVEPNNLCHTRKWRWETTARNFIKTKSKTTLIMESGLRRANSEGTLTDAKPGTTTTKERHLMPCFRCFDIEWLFPVGWVQQVFVNDDVFEAWTILLNLWHWLQRDL